MRVGFVSKGSIGAPLARKLIATGNNVLVANCRGFYGVRQPQSHREYSGTVLRDRRGASAQYELIQAARNKVSARACSEAALSSVKSAPITR